MNETKDRFFIVYEWMPALGIKGAALMVYAAIYSFTVRGRCYCGSCGTLAQMTGFAVRTVFDALRELERKELISRVGSTPGSELPAYVALRRDKPDKSTAKTAPEGSAETAGGHAESAEGACENCSGGMRNLHIINNNTYIDNKMCIKKPSSGGLTESVSTRKKDETVFKEEFEELWKLYPRRQGHSEALKAYMDARHSGVTKEAVLRGVKAYARWIEVCRTDPRYVRQGGKWFQSRDWEDAESLEKAAAGGMLPRLGETNNPAAIRSKDHFYTRENLRKLGITFGDEDDDDDEDTG